METMNIVDIDSGSSETEIFQAGRLPHAENAQGDAYKRRVSSQRAPWQTVIAVAACTALIFLVVRCTVQLASHKGTSVRLLAGSDGGEGGWRRHRLQVVSDSDSDSCKTESHHAKGRKKGGGRRRWWKKKKSYSPIAQEAEEAESLLMEQPSSDPLSSFPESHGIENSVSDAPPPGRREWHTTSLSIGGTRAEHYKNISGMYGFPLLGTGEAYQPLREKLRQAQNIVGVLCFPHKGMYTGQFVSISVVAWGSRSYLARRASFEKWSNDDSTYKHKRNCKQFGT
ncbi:hypothetical protein EPH_0064760 [Eimeria praecox]|uniref:Uncharacterized protein n=1 Tax=Eimeria praecox TaxID=51316 RepID=U6GZL5_9EIME|nr:hypothetical protein EPH_0064760 [Eimeria praecox]